MLRYRVTLADGRRVEHNLPIGLVAVLPKESDAWREVDRLQLLIRINDDSDDVRIHFDALAEHYLKADFGADAVRPKSENTTPIVRHYVRDYLVARWGKEIAENIKPLEIQRWLKSLNDVGLAWTTVSKIRGIMHRVFKIGVLHELVHSNPVEHVETRCKTDDKDRRLPSFDNSVIRCTMRSCSLARRRRSGHLRFWRCAGRTCCGWRAELGSRSAGPKGRTARPRRKRRADTSRCIGLWQANFSSGASKRLTAAMMISFFHP